MDRAKSKKFSHIPRARRNQIIVWTTMAIISNRNDPRLFKRADGRQLFTGDIL